MVTTDGFVGGDRVDIGGEVRAIKEIPEDAPNTLTVEDMVMAGLSKSWASVPNSDLRDPLTMAARCWAAVGFKALVEGGDVVLPPMACESMEAAA